MRLPQSALLALVVAAALSLPRAFGQAPEETPQPPMEAASELPEPAGGNIVVMDVTPKRAKNQDGTRNLAAPWEDVRDDRYHVVYDASRRTVAVVHILPDGPREIEVSGSTTWLPTGPKRPGRKR